MRIVTHDRPHLDEMCAWWFLRWFGEKKFPGIKQATFETYRDNYPRESHDTILIGIGGGRFDEHPVDGQERKQGCAATLVAEYLGINEMPELIQLLDFVEWVDTQGGNPFDWNDLARVLNDAKLDTETEEEHLEKVVDTVFRCLNAKFVQQRIFHRNVPVFNRESCRKELPNGVSLVWFEGDLEMAASIARSPYSPQADVIVLRNSDGTQVLTNHQNPIVRSQVDRLAGMLRFEEQKAAGRVQVSDWQQLTRDGSLKEVPQWFYSQPSRCILNGSLGHKLPPTRLSMGQIIAIAEKAMTYQPASIQNRPTRPRPQSRPRTRATA